jgi:hypothetical protein
MPSDRSKSFSWKATSTSCGRLCAGTQELGAAVRMHAARDAAEALTLSLGLRGPRRAERDGLDGGSRESSCSTFARRKIDDREVLRRLNFKPARAMPAVDSTSSRVPGYILECSGSAQAIVQRGTSVLRFQPSRFYALGRCARASHRPQSFCYQIGVGWVRRPNQRTYVRILGGCLAQPTQMTAKESSTCGRDLRYQTSYDNVSRDPILRREGEET